MRTGRTPLVAKGRTASPLLAGVAALGLVLLAAAPSGADEQGTTVFTVEGALVTVMVDGEGVATMPLPELTTYVEIDGSLLELSPELTPDEGVTGDTVRLTIEADADLSRAEALEIATNGAADAASGAPVATPAGPVAVEDTPVTTEGAPTATADGPVATEDALVATEDALVATEDALVATEDALVATEVPAESAPLPTAEAPVTAEDAEVPTEDAQAPTLARVTEVAVTGTPEPAAPTLAESAVGTHRLTVLPVYWSSRDSATRASLASLATSTAAYWAAQSAGQITVQADARDWARIADPGSCDANAIWDAALAAYGLSAPTANQHYAIYFPWRADCGGWAGLASIGAGYVWINGYQYVDVLAHEFGHNLGLGHANRASCGSGTSRTQMVLPVTSCTVTEYGDTADVMGIASTSASGNLNTALADFLGLAVVQHVSTSSVTVDLSPLASVDALRSLAIPVVGGTLYVDFRPATGRDVRTPAWAGVQVHMRVMDRGYPTTYLLDMTAPATSAFSSPQMPSGASWAIPGTNMALQVASVGATARVTVREVAPPEAEADSIAVVRGGTFFLRSETGGVAGAYGFGNPTDNQVMGDWDGNGTRTPGVFRGGAWYLRNTNNQGGVDVVLVYGSPGDVPVVGDWDGDGVDTVGVFRGGRWYLRNSNTSGMQDVEVGFGSPGDVPVVGDWDGDGYDTIGIFRNGEWNLSDHLNRGYPDYVNGYGSPGDTPVVGDWDGDGYDTIGVQRNGHWYLSNRLDRGVQDIAFGFGNPGDRAVVFR